MSWWKKIPHPPYGNYCGRNLTHLPDDGIEPIDDLDTACQFHDYTEDDEAFVDMMMKPKMKFAKWWGPIYRAVALLVFAPIVEFKKMFN